MFPYRIRKVKNISSNILVYEGKSNEKDGLVKTIQCVQRCKSLKD